MKPNMKWITSRVGYLPAPVNTGFLVDDKQAVIVDTGLDRDHASKIVRILEAEDLTPVAIINTHSHADHCGGNAYLQQKCGVPVFAPMLEKPFIEQPYLESFGLYGGAHPPAALQNKFLMAKPSQVSQSFQPEETLIALHGFSIELVPLPGHSPQQTGVLYDGVLFSADALLGESYLEKHLIPFNSDVVRHRESLIRLRHIKCTICVPSHGKPMKDMQPAIEQNERALAHIDAWLMNRCETPQTLDELFASFCSEHQVSVETISQYHLYRTAFAAHLSALTAVGEVRHCVSNSLLKWQSGSVRNPPNVKT